jgi:NADPH-dependent ferric siderophore reductase
MPTLTPVAKEHVPMAFHDVEVAAVTPLTPHLTRITLAGEDLAGFTDDGPDQRFKLFLPGPDGSRPDVPRGPDWYLKWRARPNGARPTIRTYTVRRYRPERREIDLDVVLHGDSGPASAWAGRAAVGDQVVIFGAYSEYHPTPESDWQLIAGDETALPAISAILERLPFGVPAMAFVEVGDERDELSLPVQWVHRSAGESLLEAVRAATLLPGVPYAWVAGESAAVKAIRRYLVSDLDIPADSVEFMGYWKRGAPIDPC